MAVMLASSSGSSDTKSSANTSSSSSTPTPTKKRFRRGSFGLRSRRSRADSGSSGSDFSEEFSVSGGDDQASTSASSSFSRSVTNALRSRLRRRSLKRQSVSFDDVQTLQYDDQLTQVERKELCWYTRNDFASFIMDNEMTLKELHNRNYYVDNLNQDQFCLRGLEHLYLGDYSNRSTNVRTFVERVLMTQFQLKSMTGGKMADPVSLAITASAYNGKSIRSALHRAQQDTMDARNIHRNTTKQNNNNQNDDEGSEMTCSSLAVNATPLPASRSIYCTVILTCVVAFMLQHLVVSTDFI